MKHSLYLFGLGNPGKEFAATKHNLGALVVESFAEHFKLNWSSKNDVLVAKKDGALYCLKTESKYMNELGSGLANFFRYHEPSSEPLLILLQDDSDQYEGRIKVVVGGGSAGHKGIDSITSSVLPWFANSQIMKIKLGIRPAGFVGKSERFVLQSVSSIDKQLVEMVTKELVQEEVLANLAKGDSSFLMNRFNGLRLDQ